MRRVGASFGLAAALLAASAVTLALAGCGGGTPPAAGLSTGPLTQQLGATYSPVIGASGRGTRTIHSLRLEGHVQIVGSCSGGRDIGVAFGTVKGEIFCTGRGTIGGIANRLHHSAATLVVRTQPGVRWAVVVGNHS